MKGRHGGNRAGAGRSRLLSKAQQFLVGSECAEEFRKVIDSHLLAHIDKATPDTVREEQERARAELFRNKFDPDDLTTQEVLDEVHTEIDEAMSAGTIQGASKRGRSATARRMVKGARAKVFREMAACWSEKLKKKISVRTIRRAFDMYQQSLRQNKTEPIDQS